MSATWPRGRTSSRQLPRAARRGGSRSPEELGEIVGVDLRDPGFWERGLDLVERRLEAAEEAAQAL